MLDLKTELGDIDIYLVDQILRERIRPGMVILDAGCGGGRNLVYFLRNGYTVFAADADPKAIAAVRALAAQHAPQLPASNFREEPIEAMSFEPESADVVISSAVLHFARSDAQFHAMLDGTWRMVRRGGMLFVRLASDIGMEGQFMPIGGGRYRLLDGSERYLVTEASLVRERMRLGGELLDPVKTTVVQRQRCMTTWVLRK